MRRLRLLPLVLFLAATILAPLATADELAGVTMADRVAADGQQLVLNGMGLRKKFFIKVYVAGLYLPAKTSDAAKVLAADEARRTDMHFLYGVDRGKICEGWDEGVANNAPRASAAVKEQMAALCKLMEDMEEGDRMTFTYVPGTGTTVEVKGQAKGTLEGKAFADALWSTWLGPKPPSTDFKAGLLGG
jgi:hypothetical protein